MANEFLKSLGIVPKEDDEAVMLRQPATEEVAPQVEAAQPQLSPKEAYVASQVVPAPKIQVPSFGGFQESPQERADRLARESALSAKLSSTKTEYDKALKDADDREFKQGLWAAVGNALPGIVAGATAMHTKAAVKPAEVQKIAADDLKGRVDKKYKTEYENILNQYKQLKSGDISARDRLMAEARAAQMGLNAQMMQGNLDQRANGAERSAEEGFNRKMSDMSTRIDKSGIPALRESIDRIETSLGMPIEEAIKKNIDVPGYGRLESLIPDVLSGEKARNVRQDVAKIENPAISSQFGASQTAGEIARRARESGTGKFEDSKALLRHIQTLKDATTRDVNNITGAYPKEVTQEYANQTGMDLSGKPKEAPTKRVVSAQYSKSRNKTRITYSDGTTEIKDGEIK